MIAMRSETSNSGDVTKSLIVECVTKGNKILYTQETSRTTCADTHYQTKSHLPLDEKPARRNEVGGGGTIGSVRTLWTIYSRIQSGVCLDTGRIVWINYANYAFCEVLAVPKSPNLLQTHSHVRQECGIQLLREYHLNIPTWPRF